MFVFQGEYIAPEKIEVLYDRSPLVGQVLIYGDSLKSNLVAIIIPDELAVQAWADSKGISASFEDICLWEDLNAEIIKQVGIPPSSEYISSLGREKLLEKKNFRKNCYYIQDRADIGITVFLLWHPIPTLAPLITVSSRFTVFLDLSCIISFPQIFTQK